MFAVPEDVAYGQIVTAGEVVESNATTSVKSPKVALSESTEAIVRQYFADAPIMIQIARCESTFRHYLADGTVLRGRVDNADTGVMQINKRYHAHTAAAMNLDLENIYDNMAYARHLYETQGVQPWNASRPCWGGTLAANI